MSWIHQIDESDASGTLEPVYDRIRSERGKLSNIMRIQSLHPGAMEAHMDLYMQLMYDRCGLRRAERELLAVVVSATNRCRYCIRHHAEALNAYWKDDERVEQAIEDHRQLDLSKRMAACLDYAVLLTQCPHQVEEEDVGRLREVGFSDREILSINLITSYFNFVNRIAEGLGVEVTKEEMGGYRY